MSLRSGAAYALFSAVLVVAGMRGALAADPFPTKSVRIIVPTAPGGTLDLTTRLVAQKLSEKLGQPVIVDNRPGADTMLGSSMAKNARPDGYTLLAQSEGILITPLLRLEPPFDPVKDFQPLGLMVRFPFVMEVGTDQPDRTVAEFIARAKANPGKLSYGHGGPGTPPMISAALFLRKAGLDLTSVAYKGNGAALPDVAGGRVDMIFDGYISSSAYIKGNKLRPLAVTYATRVAPLPDVPTFVEQGIDYVYPSWLGLFMPAGTPGDVAQRLSEALRATLGDKDLAARFRADGSDPAYLTPGEFADAYHKQAAEMEQLLADLKLPKQ